jgi:hypothetical protein
MTKPINQQQREIKMNFDPTQEQSDIFYHLLNTWAELDETVERLPEDEIKQTLTNHIKEYFVWSEDYHLPDMRKTIGALNKIAIECPLDIKIRMLIKQADFLISEFALTLNITEDESV